MPLVSILIPAYNAGRFIGRALEGVRTQTHKDWEVIVVEDGTHDETEAVVREFAASVSQPVRYERNRKNEGVSTTRNCAMALAQGTALAFLDADDQWTPLHLASGLEVLSYGADLCFSGFQLYDADADRRTEPPIPDILTMKDPLAQLFRCNFIQTSSLVMVRRDSAQRAGGFDPRLKVGEDCDYWIRILGAGRRLGYTGKRTCIYTKHAQSAMSKTLMVAEHSMLFYRKHRHNLNLPSGLRRRLYASSLFNYGRLVREQDPELACDLFVQAWEARPWDLRCLVHAGWTFLRG